MQYTDNDTFYKIKEQNLEDRKRIHLLAYLLTVNFIVLLCLAFNWCWWEKHNTIAFGVSMLYLLSVCSIHIGMDKRQRRLFYIFDSRNECYRDYYESPDFVYHYPPPPPQPENVIVIWTNQIDCAPIYNGDIVVLSDGDCLHYWYLKANYEHKYNLLSLTDLYNKEVLYSVESSDYELLCQKLKEKLQEDNLTIYDVRNKYGDIRWQKSDKKTNPSKWRKFFYYVKFWAARIFYFAIVILPVLVILK